MKLDELLGALHKVRKTGPDAWLACCPAHEDKSPSLAIKRTDETILIHCFSGCGAEEVLSAVGMTFDDMYPEHRETVKPQRFPPRDILLAVREHSLHVGMCAATMRKRPLTDSEKEQLLKSAELLQFAASMGGV